MAPAVAPDSRNLNELISSTLTLLEQFSSSLSNSNSSSSTPVENAPNPLHVLRDAAALLKAHTTKLCLLAINKPFTPSALMKVLREAAASCLPAIMSAAQMLSQETSTYGVMMRREAQQRVTRVFKELGSLLNELRSITDEVSSATVRRDSLSSTGMVWESCDALVELGNLGVAGLAVKRAEQYRDAIKDAIEELQEWREGGDLETEGRDALLDSDDEGVDGDADSLNDMFNAPNSMPQDRPELKVLVEEAEGKLKKVVLLYTAVVKRRLKIFRGVGTKRLDEVMEKFETVQSDVDEMASCFYELDEDKVKEGLERCLSQARDACKTVEMSWEGEKDEFTTWAMKWEEAIG